MPGFAECNKSVLFSEMGKHLYMSVKILKLQINFRSITDHLRQNENQMWDDFYIQKAIVHHFVNSITSVLFIDYSFMR